MNHVIDIHHIAKIARLQLSDDEAALYGAQLDRILGFFDALAPIDTEGVPTTAHPLAIANAWRDDVPQRSLSVDEVLANAPQREGDYFRVPKILER